MGNEKIFKIINKDLLSKELKEKVLECNRSAKSVMNYLSEFGSETDKKKLKKELEDLELISYSLISKGLHFINCVNRAPFNTYQVGDYIKIKVNLEIGDPTCFDIRQLSSSYIFGFNDVKDIEITKMEGA
jgi:hypothetical protein